MEANRDSSRIAWMKDLQDHRYPRLRQRDQVELGPTIGKIEHDTKVQELVSRYLIGLY
jgi:hypothetical protein